ncbi:tetratricopeptide repeat protein [Thermodesulforhabdus norvegica]|uniref:Tetratricopeptide repeat-containing protein n=1 Tax=Thermodesulforhabdus norvegica TaxID=39841 RepID=A0A1I4TAN6_9BACT|nr:tetratricopeptide repeat protein [Thermodesulforhabdus norvegica]SFM73794.1 Tetratricopeptide repeat-containing protein [Thermodesulforhabdus norvegica]
MNRQAEEAKVLVFRHPEKEAPAVEEPTPAEREEPTAGLDEELSEFVDSLIDGRISVEKIRREAANLYAEVELLRRENRWNDILELCHPVEEKISHILHAGCEEPIVGIVVFALTQLKRFDEALGLALKMLSQKPDDFRLNAQVAYIAYANLQAARNREVLLTPENRRKLIDTAHKHLARCQELRPNGVTSFYRRGVLYKDLQGKPQKARPYFEQAVKNWRAYSEEERERHHQERKNYVKSLYNLALCLIEDEPARALSFIRACIEEDGRTGYLGAVHKYYTLGKVYRQMGSIDRAVQALERALVDADPAVHAHVYHLIALCYMDKNNPQKALEVLHPIPRKARKPYILRLMASAHVAMGAKDKGRSLLLQAAEADRKGRHKALLELARIEITCGEFRKALDYLEKAENFFREKYGNPYMDGLFWKAVVMIKLGDLKKAGEVLEELHRFNPRYPGLKKLMKVVSRKEVK